MANSLAGKGRVVNEKGYVLSKRHQEATDAWQSSDGRTIAGKKEADILLIVSSYQEDKNTGLVDPTVLEYVVDKNTFDNAVFMSSMEVQFEINVAGGRMKPVSATLISK